MKLITIFLFTVLFSFQTDLTSVRSNFEKAEKSRESTLVFYNSLKDYHRSDPVILAYKGAAFGLQARFTADRKTKKELFVSGVRDLEGAVAMASDNVEIRLIRLIIQENTPKLLKYKMNISEDKQMILTNFGKQSKAVKDAIKRYATQRSKIFTAEELKIISK